jgi:hypothetical protein
MVRRQDKGNHFTAERIAMHIETCVPFAELSQWYLAMALLKKRDFTGAKIQLIYLMKTSEDFRQKAESIIKDLD